jgi:prepilin-type N-terminal cleavage/methylation domain-containing protein
LTSRNNYLNYISSVGISTKYFQLSSAKSLKLNEDTKMLTSTTLNSRRQQRGITLIEVSIGLIIAAIIAAAAFIAFQNNSRRSEVRESVATITATLAEVQQKFGRTNGYVGMTRATVLESGTIEAVNTYSGNICVNGILNVNGLADPAACVDGQASAAVANDARNAALVTWTNVPLDQCLDIVTGTMQGATTVWVGATEIARNGQLLANATCGNVDPVAAVDWVVRAR